MGMGGPPRGAAGGPPPGVAPPVVAAVDSRSALMASIAAGSTGLRAVVRESAAPVMDARAQLLASITKPVPLRKVQPKDQAAEKEKEAAKPAPANSMATSIKALMDRRKKIEADSDSDSGDEWN